MLEERQSRLLPEAVAEEQGRVDRGGQHRGGNQLGQVVKRDELFGADLIMNLEAGVAGLHHHVVVRHLQFINALDVDVESAAAQGADGAVQLKVARDGCEVGEGKVGRL